MRRIAQFVGCAVAAVVIAAAVTACGGDDDGNGTSSEVDDQAPALLFVQQAERGTFDPLEAEGPNAFTLTLQDVTPRTVYFADRPDRISGTIAADAFAGLETLFLPDDPPNAAVVIHEPESDTEDVVIVELMNPRYDEASTSFSYDVVVLDEVTEGLRNFEEDRDASPPSNLESPVSVFIDDATPASCNDVYSWDNTTIDVTVEDDSSGQPLEGARVALFGTSSPDTPSATRTTDATGVARFSVPPSNSLVQGYYRLVVTHPDYSVQYDDQIADACADQTVEVLARL